MNDFQAQSMDEQFERYNAIIESKQELSNSLRDHVALINAISRKLSFSVNKLGTMLETSSGPLLPIVSNIPVSSGPIFSSFPGFVEFAEDSLLICNDLIPFWENVSSILGKYESKQTNPCENTPSYDYWRAQVSSIMLSALLLKYFTTGTLLTYEDIMKIIHVPSTIGLPLEEYLTSVALLPGELPRFAISAVHAKMYHVPAALYSFANNVYSGMRLLNMRNDQLRKKFDAMKYATTKLSDISFDLEIRQLTNNKEATPNH